MAPRKSNTPEIERPCSLCHHLHEGIPCMETGCECKKSVPAEVPHPQVDTRTDSEPISAGGEPAGGNTETLKSDLNSQEPIDQQQAPYDAGLRNSLPLQERLANVIEDFEAEAGRMPIGCELIIRGEVFCWTGEKFEKAPDTPAEPPPAPAIALSEEDQAKVRELFAAQTEVKDLPDGSVMLPLRIDAGQIEILKAWAEGAGENWISYAQRTLEMALNAVINGGAVAG